MIYSYNDNINQYPFQKELLQKGIVTRNLNKTSKKYKTILRNDLNNGRIQTEIVKECICGCKNLKKITNVDRFGLPFGSLVCVNCGLILTSPRIKQGSLQYYYDKIYHPLNFGKENFTKDDALFDSRQGYKIFELVSRYATKKSKLKVLEIGAGTGNVLKGFKVEAAKSNIEVEEIGTEYKSDFVKLGQEQGVNIVYGDVNTIIDNNVRYDLIILSHVFEHFIDLKEEIKKLGQIIESDGVLYVEVPGVLVNHKKGGYKFSYLGYHVHAHMYNFTLSTLNNVFSRYGWELICGNEEVEAVFRPNITTKSEISNDYMNIMFYLNFLGQNQDSLENEFEHNKSIERQFKNQNQTILNREQTIDGKEHLLEKKEEIIKELKNKTKTLEGISLDLSEEQETFRNLLNQKQQVIENYEKTIARNKESLEVYVTQLSEKENIIINKEREMKELKSELEESAKSINVKTQELAIVYNYYYMLIESIQKITESSLFKKPYAKYKAYKNMMKIYKSIRRYFR